MYTFGALFWGGAAPEKILWMLFTHYWDVILLFFLAPIIIFLFISATIIVINSALIVVEWVVVKIYGIRRPCPVCGTSKEMRYISKNGNPQRPHPVALRPGVYGTFRHKSPYNSDKLPTLFLFGKWKLRRLCQNPDCLDKVTTSDMTGVKKKVGIGKPIHIGIVGHRASGKSYLLYGGLGLLQQIFPKRLSQIDQNSETNIAVKKASIDLGLGIQTNVEDWYRAIQMIYKAPARMMPYHLFCYDVAGEKFDSDKRTQLTGLDFYRNVQSIVFVIDVAAVDLAGGSANESLVEWIEQQKNDEKHNLIDTLSVLLDILKTKVGRNAKDIDFNMVCVKKDLGYFEAVGYNSDTIRPEKIEKFLFKELGLSNFVNMAKTEFKSIGIHAVSVISKNTDSLKNLFFYLLKQKRVVISHWDILLRALRVIVIIALMLTLIWKSYLAISNWIYIGIEQREAERVRIAEEKIQEEKKRAEIAFAEELKRQQREKIREQQAFAQKLNIETVFIQGGTFSMGCTWEQDILCHQNEKPVRIVTVNDFYIGKYEVTQAQWKAVMGDNPSHFGDDDLPVENVSWNDVQVFLKELNSMTGKRYRLPTEAEWEFAARGGLQSKNYIYSGSNFPGNVAQYSDNSTNRTHPAGGKASNELGIHDMSGNVSEWVSDLDEAYGVIDDINPSGASSGYRRVLRGGSWKRSADCARVSCRNSAPPDHRANDIGLRLVLTAQ